MSEILLQTGSELRIVANADGSYTARVGVREGIFADFKAAIEWACAIRDGEKK